MKALFRYCLLFLITTGVFGCQSGNQSEPGQQVEEPRKDGIDKAMLHEFLVTRDPALNRVPRERLMIARQALQAAWLSRTAQTAALSWQERGPSSIGGRTRALIIDRRDASGNTVWAASVSGGIFKTTAFTSSQPAWQPVDDKMLNLAVTAMVQDSTNPNIMYAGTGEGWFNIDAVKGAGIFKSSDGGISWNLLPTTTTFEFVQDIITDRFGNVYASLRNQLATGARGVQRSTDGGLTWTQVLGAPLPGFATGRAADLELASNGDVYATLGVFSPSQVWKSSFAIHGANTGGLTSWTDITPARSYPTQRAELAVAPSNPQRLYLMMQNTDSKGVSAIFRSSNAGATWDSVAAPTDILNGDNTQTWYNLIAAVNPSNPDELVIGGLHIGRSQNAGGSWANVSSGTVHVDQHMLLYFGTNKLYAGNDGGVYYSDNINAVAPGFSNRNSGYRVTQYYSCDYHPSNPNYFLAGAQDNGTQKFTLPGINPGLTVSGGDGAFSHIDQTDGQIQVTAAQYNNLFRSLDGGATFIFQGSVSNARGLFINASDYDDAQNILYSGDEPGQYYVVSNWLTTPTGSVKTLPGIGVRRQVSAVKVDPFTPNTVWLGTTTADDTTTAQVPVLLKVTSANTSPVVAVTATLPVPAGSTVSSIDVDSADAAHILVTLSNYGVPSVLESTNGGVSFTSIEGNLPDMPVRWGIFAPRTTQLNGAGNGNGGILLATELGVWTASSINGVSTNWIPNNDQLPNVRTDMLKYRSWDGVVVAATHGRGLFTTTLTGAGGGGVEPGTTPFIRYISATSNNLLVVTGTSTATTMDIRLFDMLGRLVYQAGKNYGTTNIGLRFLSSGVYVVRITGNNGEQYKGKFIKL
ncbi:MAG TPA: T9SS type A sorting domain-containing protein [Flavisolibacter sp.]